MKRIVLAGLFATTAMTAFGDVLTFDGAICSTSPDGSGAMVFCPNGLWINQSYGDTASVNVTYDVGGTGNSMQRWDTGYSDLTNVAYGFFGGGFASIVLTPLGGGTLTLNSFQLGTIPPTVSRDASVTVVDIGTNAVVFSASFTNGGGNPVGVTATTVSPAVSSSAGLRLIYTADVFNVAIDTVNFDVSDPSGGVPEPSTFAMLGGALALLALRRR